MTHDRMPRVGGWLVLGAMACGAAPVEVASGPTPIPAKAEAAPGVALVRPMALAQRMGAPGAPRLINFWATWCGPCREEQPRLAAFAAAHPDLEMVWVSLDVVSLRDSKVTPHLRASGWLDGITQLQLDDPDPAMALARMIPEWPDAVPVTLVVDPSGAVVRTYGRSVSEEDLDTIAVLLKLEETATQ